MPAARHLIAGWISLVVAGGALAVAARVPQPLELQQVSAGGPRPAVTTSLAPTTVPPTTVVPTPPPVTVPPPPPTTVAKRPAAPRPTTTTGPPAPAPAPNVAVAPPPASVTNAPAPASTSEYALSLVQQMIPAAWLVAVPVHIDVIPGKTSWSSFGGLIEVGDWQLTSSVGRAKFTLAHEWGHQVAWRFGTDTFNGAGPAGFPYAGPLAEEQWADCVAQALLGTSFPTSGLGACPADSLAFTRSWLNAGPGTPLR